jgi:hypothetical protein
MDMVSLIGRLTGRGDRLVNDDVVRNVGLWRPDQDSRPGALSGDHVRVSKIAEPQPGRSDQRPVLLGKTQAKEPSVLLPTYNRKSESKKKDYPFA